MEPTLSEGIALHQAGNLPAAEKLYLKILHESPKHPKASFHLGRLALQCAHPEPALNLIKTAWDGLRGDEQVGVVLLKCLLELGRVAEAQQFASSSSKRFSFRGEEFEGLRRLASEIAAGRHPTAAQARAYRNKFLLRQFDSLIEELQPRLLDWPCWAEGWALLGAAISLNADFSRLIAEHSKSEGDPDGQQPAFAVKVLAQESQANLALARDHLAQALSLDPHNAFAKQHMVRVQFECGNSLADLQPCLEGAPFRSSEMRQSALVSIKQYCRDQGLDFQKIAGQSAISIEAPPFIGTQFDYEPAIGITWSNDVYCTTLANATLIAKQDLILAGADQALHDKLSHPLGIVLDTSREDVIVARDEARLLLNVTSFTTKLAADSAIAMTGISTYNFGHWMFEYLPRLRALEQHASFRQAPIYVDAEMPPAHLEALRLLVGKEHHIVEIEGGTAVIAKQLIVATPSIFFPYICKAKTPASVHLAPIHTDDMRFIRARILVALGLDPSRKADGTGRRIFLRRDGGLRRLLNQDEIEKLLVSRHGFEVVKPEAFPFSEQVKMFNEAEVVFGPHSSAFCNLAFCPVGARAGCLVQSYAANFPAWSHAVHSIGVKHLYVAGNPVPGSSWHEHHLDYYVPLELVAEALEFCLAPASQHS